MKEVIIENKKHYLPENWGEVTFEQFTRIANLQKSIKANENDAVVLAKLAAVILNIHVADLYFMSLVDFQELGKTIMFVFEKEPKAATLKDMYVVRGKTLYVDKDLRKYTAGTMLSYLLTTQDKEDENDKARYAVAILLRETEDRQFDADLYHSHATLVYTMGVEDVMALSAFFLNTSTIFTQKNLESCLQPPQDKQAEAPATDSIGGDGMGHSKSSQWATLTNTPKLTRETG